jgi:hypothetical protein
LHFSHHHSAVRRHCSQQPPRVLANPHLIANLAASEPQVSPQFNCGFGPSLSISITAVHEPIDTTSSKG